MQACARQLLVVIGTSGAAEVAWSAAAAAELEGLPALYRPEARSIDGIMRPFAPAAEPATGAAARAPRAVPPGFAVTIAPVSPPWRAGPVLHRVTYTWAGTLPLDTYEWPDGVPATLAEALARCRAALVRARRQAARLAGRPEACRRAEVWGERQLAGQLDPRQRDQLRTERRFRLRAPSGRCYLLARRPRRNVWAVDERGARTTAYSLAPAAPVALGAQLGQQAWLLRHDERRFLRFALATRTEEAA